MKYDIEKLERIIVEGLFVEPTLLGNGVSHSRYEDEEFTILVARQPTQLLFSIDLNSAFNKESQCPIHFVVDGIKGFPYVQECEIRKALKHLKDNKDIAGTFVGFMEGFEEFSDQKVRPEFYSQWVND